MLSKPNRHRHCLIHNIIIYNTKRECLLSFLEMKKLSQKKKREMKNKKFNLSPSFTCKIEKMENPLFIDKIIDSFLKITSMRMELFIFNFPYSLSLLKGFRESLRDLFVGSPVSSIFQKKKFSNAEERGALYLIKDRSA